MCGEEAPLGDRSLDRSGLLCSTNVRCRSWRSELVGPIGRIGLIGLIRSSFSRGRVAGLRAAILRAGAIETLGEAAFFEELAIQGFELAVLLVVTP